MTYKKIIQILVFPLFALTVIFIPLSAQAGGICGGAYTIESGDTVNELAAMCGTSASAIYAANPGIKEPLTVGQTITIPDARYGTATQTSQPTLTGTLPTPTPTSQTPPATPTPAAVINNYYYYYGYYPPELAWNIYIVQAGDSFVEIAARFGLDVQELLAANPAVTDINFLYMGQVLYIPTSEWPAMATVAPAVIVEDPAPSSTSKGIPANASRGTILMVNQSRAEVYVSFHITRADGSTGIFEYPVARTLEDDIPSGWIDYVAWVGGVKHTGGFNLTQGSYRTITFEKNKVSVDK